LPQSHPDRGFPWRSITSTVVAHIGWFPYSPANLYDKSAEDVLNRVGIVGGKNRVLRHLLYMALGQFVRDRLRCPRCESVGNVSSLTAAHSGATTSAQPRDGYASSAVYIAGPEGERQAFPVNIRRVGDPRDATGWLHVHGYAGARAYPALRNRENRANQPFGRGGDEVDQRSNRNARESGTR